jgi:hypothetical protein
MDSRISKLAAIALVALFVQGCILSRSISRAVGTTVKSVSDASKSSSDRLTADAEADDREYRDDFRVATRDWAARGSDALDLQRELGRVAELHGVVDWETRPDSLRAIGSGACQADASGARLEVLLGELDVDTTPALEGCRSVL